MNDVQELLTKSEVCDILRIDISTLNRYINQGRLKAIAIGAGKHGAKRISRDELKRFLGGGSNAQQD